MSHVLPITWPVAVALALSSCCPDPVNPFDVVRAECPGGVTTDGDCCRRGQACGASCISRDDQCGIPRETADAAPVEPNIEVLVARSPSDMPSAPPAAGEYRVHLIDVGTGLAMLIQGADFNMLFDGGSGDDKRGISESSGNNSRLLAYLWHALGASGPEDCAPNGDGDIPQQRRPELTIDHVVLSHPHEDHGVFLDELLHCYDVDHVWDVGVVNDALFYEQFLQAVAAEPDVVYHTVADIPPGHTVSVRGNQIQLPSTWEKFPEGHVEHLDDQGARFEVLHADAAEHNDFNENSLVLRVDLAGASMLLTGDAESGERAPPSADIDGTEAYLLRTHGGRLDVDILQVGHHGSMTSSRRTFLDAVSPEWALIGSGTKSYSGVELPDDLVVQALLTELGENVGDDVVPTTRVLSTKAHDEGGCPAQDRVGDDDPGRVGGCDNYVLTISDS